MTIKMKAVEATALLENKAILTKSWPFKTGYELAHIVNKLQDELVTWQKKRQEIIDEFAVRDEAGKIIQKDGMVSLKDPAQAQERLNQLAEIEIEIQATPVKINMDNAPEISIEEGRLLSLIMEV
jgi:hypothetical protein